MLKKWIISILIAVFCLSTMASVDIFAAEIKIAGSEPMVPIVKVLAENFTMANPGISIDVKGGTTDFGFEALKKDTVTIVNASARIQPADIIAFKEKGTRHIEFVLAQDNICVIVNNANQIKNLTLEQVKDIYAGKIKNWKEVGGNDLQITLYGRELNSAQSRFFKEKLGINTYDASMQQISDEQEALLLKNDPAGIAFVGLAYAKSPDIKAIALKIKEGFQPLDPFDISTNDRGIYPLTRKLYQYTTAEKLTPEVKSFLNYEFGVGQTIISANGTCAATLEEIEANLIKLKTKPTAQE